MYLPQTFYRLTGFRIEIIDLFLGNRVPQGKTQRALGFLWAAAHGKQHVAGFWEPGSAGRTGGHADAPFPQNRQCRASRNAPKATFKWPGSRPRPALWTLTSAAQGTVPGADPGRRTAGSGLLPDWHRPLPELLPYLQSRVHFQYQPVFPVLERPPESGFPIRNPVWQKAHLRPWVHGTCGRKGTAGWHRRS